MIALIRDSEIIVEPFSPWVQEHLEWLTTPRPDGDGYTLVQNYIPPTENTPEQFEIVEPTPTPAAEEPEVEVIPDSNVVIIDGKEYTKEELRALLGE